MLVNYRIGEALGVGKKRLNRIKEKSSKLSQEILEFAQKKQREAFDLLDKELTSDEKAKLSKFFGAKKLEANFKHAGLETIFEHNSFDDETSSTNFVREVGANGTLTYTRPKPRSKPNKHEFEFDWDK